MNFRGSLCSCIEENPRLRVRLLKIGRGLATVMRILEAANVEKCQKSCTSRRCCHRKNNFEKK